ncbi:MAG: GspE/PulE family protein, partial [candidate division WOR-3 bacterium]
MGSLVGEMFLKSGLISEDQLKKALDLQKEKHKRLGEILIELGYISLNDLVWILSEQASIPFIEIRPEMLDSNLIDSLPE